MRLPVILDCDTGTDDAVAIALAVLHPDLYLVGVTTVWGNHELSRTTDNTLRVLDHLGAPAIPVHAGLAGPYAGRRPGLPTGRDDLPPTLDLPATTRSADSDDAVGWLVETLRAAPGPIALVATGPWSNVAATLAADPGVAGALDRLVLLGGAHARAGVTAYAERNVWCDPAAAAFLLERPLAPTTVVTTDATCSVPLGEGDADGFDALGTRAGDLAASMLRERIAWYRRDPVMAALDSAPLHDPLAVAALVDPSLLDLRSSRATVEVREGEQQGRTVFHLRSSPTLGDGVLQVALGADSAAYRSSLGRALARPGRDSTT